MSKNQPSYSITRWPHGWTLNAPPYIGCVPVTAYQEIMPLLEKNAVLDPSIAHHLRTSGLPDTMEAIASPKEADIWRAEIEDSLKNLDPQERWWRGTHTGKSSATIFSTFCHPKWQGAAKHLGRGSHPRDAADLGRCLRLLTIFPEWEKELHKVAESYPNGPWPKIIPQWEILKKSTPAEQSKFLQNV